MQTWTEHTEPSINLKIQQQQIIIKKKEEKNEMCPHIKHINLCSKLNMQLSLSLSLYVEKQSIFNNFHFHCLLYFFWLFHNALYNFFVIVVVEFNFFFISSLYSAPMNIIRYWFPYHNSATFCYLLCKSKSMYIFVIYIECVCSI